MQKPIIAVTAGDPAGIGPEIVGELFTRFTPRGSVAVIVGSAAVFERYRTRWGKRVRFADAKESAARATGDTRVMFMDSGCRARFTVGRDGAGGGRHAASALDLACELVKRHGASAIVTAPISKDALNRAGYRFSGHTEYFAKVFRSPDCQMVMTYRNLRVVPITRHLPIRRVSGALSRDRIVRAILVVEAALRDQYGVASPRIAVAGLNPHAGEGGLIGREEIDTIVPALNALRRRSVDVTGPVPADALFQHTGDGTFDAFVTMYHDQGLIPFKMLSRRRGVNVTVGLPIVRTSVDHGVAYDIAGHGVADTASLEAAYRLAEKLVRRHIISQRKASGRWNNATS